MSICSKVLENIFTYRTPKIVTIKNRAIGIVNRLIQLTIFIYIIGYVIIYKKGYQDTSIVEGFVTIKVKGVIFTNYSDSEFDPKILNPEWYRRIWGPADYVVPPTQTMASFVVTNIVITRNQTQGNCAEDPDVPGAKCIKENNSCVAGTSLHDGNGVLTGNCIDHPVYNESTCEVFSWCPTQVDELPLKKKLFLGATKDLTMLVKNYVHFPKFPDSKRRNIKNTENSSYLSNCIYDSDSFPDCPIFLLRNIVKESGYSDYDYFAKRGGIISIVINWDCDFDYDKNDCLPTYTFNALSNPETKLSPGWSFRHAIYFSDTVRTLHKLYGIRFSFSINGQAGKFGIIPLLKNIGSGLGLLAIGVVVCDVVVLLLVKERDYFKAKKYEAVIPKSTTKIKKNAVKKRQA